MTSQANSPDLDDFECLAETMYEQACERSTITDVPVGVVLAGVIFHLAVEAQLGGVPAGLLCATIEAAAARYRGYERDAYIAEACQ